MSSNQRNWVVFFSAVAVTGLMSAVYLGSAGSSDENLRLVLRVTARCAFIVLLLVFVARPLQQLFHTPLTAALLRNRRLIGIAFAGIHTAHLGCIIYRARVIDTFEFTLGDNLLGAFTYAVVLLMFLTSFNATTKLLGARNWRLLHTAGLYWLFVAFTLTLLPESLDRLGELEPTSWAILALVATALVIRLTAFLAKRQRSVST